MKEDKPYTHIDEDGIETKCSHVLILPHKTGRIFYNTCDEVGSEKGLIYFLDINPHLDSRELFKVVKSTFMFDSLMFPQLKKDIRRLVIDRLLKK